MNSISYTTVRKSLAQTMDKVCEDHTPVIITRQKANPVVMLSLDDYHTLEETAYLLRSPRNAARLAQAIDEIEEGKARERALTE